MMPKVRGYNPVHGWVYGYLADEGVINVCKIDPKTGDKICMSVNVTHVGVETPVEEFMRISREMEGKKPYNHDEL